MTEVEITTIGTLSLPIPLYATNTLGSMRSKDGDTFTIVAGLDKKLVAQLKALSLDECDTEIQQNTSDRQRFGEGSYEEWYGKDRVPFGLVHEKDGKLAALAWFGPKPLGRKSLKHLSEEERKQDERLMGADNWHTIVYRAYNPFRGKGLMKAFVAFAMEQYLSKYPDAKLWAGVYADNPASTGLASKLGFKILVESSQSDSHETVMVRLGE